MDVISLQEAKKASRKVGELEDLHTSSKENAVSAINELKSQMRSGMTPNTFEKLVSAATGEVNSSWLNFMSAGFITGIKVVGDELTGQFSLKIYTKPPELGGSYVYYSGQIMNIIWDVPENDIPFFDESGEQKIYLVLENNGPPANFKVQVFVLK